MSYFRVKDLMCVRLVCKIWSLEAMTILQKRTLVNLDKQNYLHRLTSFIKYLKENETFVHSGYEIHHDVKFVDSGNYNVLIFELFRQIKETHKIQISHLSITLGTTSLRVLSDLLDLVPHLRKLRLTCTREFNIKNIQQGLNLGIRSGGKFKCLKTFIFRNEVFTETDRKNMIPHLFEILHKKGAHLNLEDFKVNDPLTMSGMGFGALSIITDWETTTLSEIRITHLGEDLLRLLTDIQSPLKILKVGGVRYDSLSELVKVFIKNAATLIVLRIDLKRVHSSRAAEDIRVKGPLNFNFPKLPAIRKLRYAVGQFSELSPYWEDVISLFDGAIFKIFEGGGTGFAERFPQLTHLRFGLASNFDRERNNLWSTLGRIPQLNFLSVQITSEDQNQEEQLRETFPNAVIRRLLPKFEM